MTDTEIKTEMTKRFINGAKSNLCVFGCGSRTSTHTAFHYTCYLTADSDQLSRVYRLGNEVLSR